MAVGCRMGLTSAADVNQTAITKDDLLIPKNVAYNIAVLFVNDAFSLVSHT